jgi:hypothetical protein
MATKLIEVKSSGMLCSFRTRPVGKELRQLDGGRTCR